MLKDVMISKDLSRSLVLVVMLMHRQHCKALDLKVTRAECALVHTTTRITVSHLPNKHADHRARSSRLASIMHIRVVAAAFVLLALSSASAARVEQTQYVSITEMARNHSDSYVEVCVHEHIKISS